MLRVQQAGRATGTILALRMALSSGESRVVPARGSILPIYHAGAELEPAKGDSGVTGVPRGRSTRQVKSTDLLIYRSTDLRGRQ